MKTVGVSEINKKKLKNITTIEKCLDKKSPYVQCFSIDTAQTNENEWVSGSEVRLKTCGYVCGCSAYHTAKRYKTRSEAFTAECSRVREYLKCHIKVTDGVIGVMVDSGATRLLRLLDEIEKPKPIQLELF